MDHYLKDVDNGVEKQPAVRYFVMGHDQWLESSTWPPAAHSTDYYLQAPKDTVSTGSLTTAAPSEDHGSATFVSDPEHPVENKYSSSGAHDYRDLTSRDDLLTYDSPPLQRAIEVTGPIQADIYMACDCRDADLWVRLLDVAPDGTAYNLMSPGLNALRASYRDEKLGQQLLQPSHVYRLRLDHLITSNVFQQGHRIRVQISGSFFPDFSRNPQTGASERTSAELQKARITIYSDRAHASNIVLPVAGN